MSLDLDGRPFPADDDDRILEAECREFAPNGRCLVAMRGERHDVGPHYGPADVDLPRRCAFFQPKEGARDQRSGRERYPELWREYEERERVRRAIADRGIARAKAALKQ